MASQSEISDWFIPASPLATALSGKVVVVKIGGSTLGSHDTALEDVAMLSKLGVKVVVVHGGGATISRWLELVGQKARFVNGLRVTDDEAMEIVTMVLAGKVNKEIIAALLRLGVRAVGLSGLDADLIRARQIGAELGRVGEITHVNPEILESLFVLGYVPVVAPIALDGRGMSLNINADTAAAEIAVAVKAEKIVFLTDVVGICDGNRNLLPYLSKSQAEELIRAGVITGGMIPKAQACCRALDSVNAAHIIDGRVANALLRQLLTDSFVGTTILR